MENKETIAENLIIRHLAAETTAVEEIKLEKWIAESPANEKLYVDFKKSLQLGRQHYDTDSSHPLRIDINTEWNQFLENVRPKQDPKVVPLEKETIRHNWLKIAAALFFVVGVSFVLNYFANQTSIIQYQTGKNTQEVILPDGSIVTLNQHSTLSYLEDFGKADRQVNLNGEAFFDVAKDKTKRFTISMKNAQVQVLGTSFNIRSYNQNTKTEVVVATGLVKLSKNDSEESITLNPGEKGVLNLNKLVTEANDDQNFLAWKTGRIIFEETQLNKVIEILNRTYRVNISTKINIPGTCEVTVIYEQQNIQSILNVLKSTLDLEYLIDGDNIEITRIGC